jgi:putative selenate reductase
MRNTAVYAGRVVSDPRYTAAGLPRAPRKIGRHLQLFDCITCDKCIPVCPNDANFALAIPPGRRPVRPLHREANGWRGEDRGTLSLDEAHQIGTFADFCNDCGNCDVFCPEDGGPYVVKPRFFGSEGAWRATRSTAST